MKNVLDLHDFSKTALANHRHELKVIHGQGHVLVAAVFDADLDAAGRAVERHPLGAAEAFAGRRLLRVRQRLLEAGQDLAAAQKLVVVARAAGTGVPRVDADAKLGLSADIKLELGGVAGKHGGIGNARVGVDDHLGLVEF